MKVNIACLQMASHPYDWDNNIEKATTLIKEAASKKADICLLPEVFIPGYSFSKDNFRQAESLEGPTISTLKEISNSLGVHIAGSFIEKTEKNFYNTMFLIGPNGLLGTYRKIHVFSLEQKYWKPGKGVTIVDTEFGAIGLGICADMHYPKLWKQYAGNVDLILICSAWPEISDTNIKYATHELQLCKNLPVQISKALQVPTAYCNACHKCISKLPLGFGVPICAGFSKIVDKGSIVASVETRDEMIVLGAVETSEQRPPINPTAFKTWIRYSLGENFVRFFAEKLPLIYAKVYYRWHKRKFLD